MRDRDADSRKAEHRCRTRHEQDQSALTPAGCHLLGSAVATPCLGEAPLADRHLDQPIAQLGDRDGERHREHELGHGEADSGELADDLINRPVEQVQAVAAGPDPAQHGVADQLAGERASMNDRRDHTEGGDAGEEKPAAEQPRVEADAEPLAGP